MPSPSYLPLIASFGFPFIATGLIYDYALVPVGAALLVVGLYGWAMEPATEEMTSMDHAAAPDTTWRHQPASTTGSC